jgi:hypothetical protein
VTRFVWRAARSGAQLLAVLLGLAGAEPGAAEVPTQSPVVERSESDILLLAVRLDQSLLAEALPTYQIQGRVLIPLGEMCRLLGLGISTDAAHGLASGFFINPKRLFELDLGARKILVEGKAKRFDPAAIEAHHDDIYVDVALFSEWLPIRLDVDLLGSAITVVPLEPLPLQLRLERERKLALAQTGQSTLSHFPKIEVPYKLFDGPFVDETLQWTRAASLQGGSQSTLNYSTYATGDFLFAEASAFVSGTDHVISDSRFSLSRKDPDGNLLGFLGAREVTVGDVFHPGLGLIALPRSGPGLLVSNYPIELPTQFDRQSFRGDLPPGWEVELYRAQELLAYAQSRPDGLYEFLDVPLLFGLNAFRLEFFGPQGQHRTETQNLNVGDSLTPKGKVYYRLVGNDPGVRLIGTGLEDVGSRSTLEVSAGLTRNLSISVSGGNVDLADGRHTYGEAGLRAFWGWLFANVDVAKDQNGGSAWQGTLYSRFGAFGLQLQHAELYQFESEAFVSAAAPLQSRTSLRLDTFIPETFLPKLPLLVEIKQDQLESGERVDQITSRLSAFSHGLSVSNQLSWAFSSGGNTQIPTNTTGQILISKYLQSFALRGEIDYQMKPDRNLTGVFLTAETRLVREFLLSVGLNRAFLSHQTQLLLGVNKLEGRFGYGIFADYSRPGGLGGHLVFSLGVGRDTRTGVLYSQARPLAGLGGVSGRAFLDTNGNGRLDEGEALIPGAGFLLNGGGNLARTDEKGDAFITNLPPYQDLDFSLATTTLEDPFWKPSLEGVRFVPRPGKVALIDFPVQIFGEITGTVYLRREGANQEASDVELELVNPQGAVIKTVFSAYDGFYDVTDIKPGHYTLRVAEKQVAEIHLLPVPAREVEMAPSGTVLDGVNFVVEEKPAG